MCDVSWLGSCYLFERVSYNLFRFIFLSFITTGPCAAEDFELEYSHCGAYRSNVVMNIGSTYDPVMVKQILSRQIQTYVEDIHASENNNEVDSIYDYPKWVRSTVYIELVGVSTPMDDDEIFLFLQEFEKGFRPKMEADNYDWINVELLYQLNTTNDQIAFTSEERSHANKVKIMPKASCSGDACNDENFYNYLIVNLEQFTGEFLGRLKAIAPSDEAETYFDDILLIRVRNERLVIPELPLESDTNTTPANVWDDVEIPFWLWILAVLAFLVVVFAMVHVCILSPRQKAMASDKEKDEFDHQSNDEDEYQSRHGQTESPI